MRAYCILGSAELFPQHCQIPNMSPHQHLRALTDELWDTTAVAASTSKGRCLLKLLQSNLQTILNPPSLTATPRTEQRVTKEQQRVREEEQRVINDTPILTIPQITHAPPIIQARNPTAKRALKNTPHIHWQQTRVNTPGGVPMIVRTHPIPHIDMGTPSKKLQQLQDVLASSRWQTRAQAATNAPPVTIGRMPTRAQQQLVSQQAINVLTIREKATYEPIFTPLALVKHAIVPIAHKIEHYANPMVRWN